MHEHTYLSKWLYPGGHLEVKFTEFTILSVSTLHPLLQAPLVHKLQTAHTYTGRDQRRVHF